MHWNFTLRLTTDRDGFANAVWVRSYKRFNDLRLPTLLGKRVGRLALPYLAKSLT